MKVFKALEKEILGLSFEEGNRSLNLIILVLRVLQRNSSKIATLKKSELEELLERVFQPLNFSASLLNKMKTLISHGNIKRLILDITQLKRKWFRRWNKSLVLIEVPNLELKESQELSRLIEKIKPSNVEIGEISFRCRQSLLGGFRVFFDFEVIDASFANLLNQIYNQIR